MSSNALKSKATIGEFTIHWRRLGKRAVSAGPALTLVIALVLSGLIAYWLSGAFLTTLSAENANRAARLRTLERDHNADLAVRQTKQQFIAEFRRLLEKHDHARQLLPEEVEVSNVLAAVQRLAAANKVRLTRFNSTSPGAKSAAADSLYERVVPTTVVGAHGAVVRFLADVARYPRIIHVRDIAITSLRKTESVDFTLVTFYSPPGFPPVPAELLAERHGDHAHRDEELKNSEVPSQ
ncbi:MAG: type 4a pilus biogenesis protein PilO [Pyrinomonadaceae bacterium]